MSFREELMEYERATRGGPGIGLHERQRDRDGLVLGPNGLSL